MPLVPPQLDHLIYAAPNLAAAVAELEEMLGIRLLPGGKHPAWGTRNAILPLSPTTYLEVIGPDPESGLGHPPALFGLDNLSAPRLVTWAAKGVDLSGLTARARSQGIELGPPSAGSRQRQDGSSISWESTDPFAPREGGVMPFFIEWGGEGHPAAGAEADAELLEFSALHPDPDRVSTQLSCLGVELGVAQGSAPALVATLQTRDGAVELR